MRVYSLLFSLVLGFSCCLHESLCAKHKKSRNIFKKVRSLAQGFKNIISSGDACFEHLGCFSTSDFNSVAHFLPDSPEKLNISFLVFTANNRYRPYRLGHESEDSAIVRSGLNPNKLTVFIVHGYTDEFDEMEWTGDFKDYILDNYADRYDVVGVSWPGGSQTKELLPYDSYRKAVANARVVGAEIAYFITQINTLLGIDPKKVHLVGHSLGAQACGWAGERFEGQGLGRITGIDPAGPEFYTDEAKARLDPTDAALVDSIHTNAGTLLPTLSWGIERNVGHFDIYPNGGTQQPGCEPVKVIGELVEGGLKQAWDFNGCSHQRVTRLMPEYSKNNECQSVAYSCPSYRQFKDGQCADCDENGNGCILMGFWPNYWDSGERRPQPSKSEAKYYVETSGHIPFCEFHYQLVVHFSQKSEKASGTISIALNGTKRDMSDINIERLALNPLIGKAFLPEDKVTKLLVYPKDLGPVTSAQISFWFKKSKLNIFAKPPVLDIEKVEVNFMSHIDIDVRKSRSTVLCPLDGGKLENKKSVSFRVCVGSNL